MYVHMNISMYGVICESKYIMYAKRKITYAEEAAVENRGFRDRDCVCGLLVYKFTEPTTFPHLLCEKNNLISLLRTLIF